MISDGASAIKSWDSKVWDQKFGFKSLDSNVGFKTVNSAGSRKSNERVQRRI